MNSVIYARVSREDSRDKSSMGHSINLQVTRGRELAAKKGYTNIAVFEDLDVSGTLEPQDRPGMKNMINMFSQVDVIIVQDSSRLSRDELIYLKFCAMCREHRVIIEGWSESIDIYDPQGRLMGSIHSAVNSHYVRQLRQKSIDSSVLAARNGKLATHPNTYGFRRVGRQKVEVREDEAEIVRSVYQMALENYSIEDITAYLNENKIYTRKGKPWVYQSIHTMLKNLRYIGKISYPRPLPEGVKKDPRERVYDIYDSPFPSIITDEIFYKVQDNLYAKRPLRKKGYRAHILSGVLMCGYCNSPYCYQKEVEGKSDRYHCKAKLRKGKHRKTRCYAPNLNAEETELYFLAHLSEFILRDLTEEKATATRNPEISVKEHKIREVKHQIKKVEDQVKISPESAPLLMNAFSSLNDDLEDLEAALRQLILEDESKNGVKAALQDLKNTYVNLSDKELASRFQAVCRIWVRDEFLLLEYTEEIQKLYRPLVNYSG